MKTKLLLSVMVVMISLIALNSCKKKIQPRFDNVTILEQTGKKIVEMEKYVLDKRSSLNPEGYKDLAKYAQAEVIKTLQKELAPEPGVLSFDGDIADVVESFIEFFQKKSFNKKDRYWYRLDVGVQDDVYRVMKGYSIRLLEMLKAYCDGPITGSSEWYSGERNLWEEYKIVNLINDDPENDDYDEWKFENQLYYYFLHLAENPDNIAKGERQGLFNLGMFDGQ